jgi:hypothetical protein|tara:strand:- start:1415 stop:2134 length:720 start_codon:yes stop_codon:yes gene_type:complete
MKIFHANQILTVFLFFYFLVSSNVAESQPKSLTGKAFFYKDIANFGGPFLKTPISKNKIIAQPFNASCSNLNRIILPFYLEKKDIGILTFKLYQNSEEKELVFSTTINVENFPPPKKIGTYNVDGVLHNVWIPPQPGSRNKQYFWELKAGTINNKARIGLYMNHHSNPQLQPVIIDELVHQNTYVAFYAYCQYRFDWDQIAETTWKRIKREKMFLLFYLVLIVGILFGIRLTRNENDNF